MGGSRDSPPPPPPPLLARGLFHLAAVTEATPFFLSPQEDEVHAAAKDVWSKFEEEKKFKVAGKEPAS